MLLTCLNKLGGEPERGKPCAGAVRQSGHCEGLNHSSSGGGGGYLKADTDRNITDKDRKHLTPAAHETRG